MGFRLLLAFFHLVHAACLLIIENNFPNPHLQSQVHLKSPAFVIYFSLYTIQFRQLSIALESLVTTKIDPLMTLMHC